MGIEHQCIIFHFSTKFFIESFSQLPICIVESACSSSSLHFGICHQLFHLECQSLCYALLPKNILNFHSTPSLLHLPQCLPLESRFQAFFTLLPYDCFALLCVIIFSFLTFSALAAFTGCSLTFTAEFSNLFLIHLFVCTCFLYSVRSHFPDHGFLCQSSSGGELRLLQRSFDGKNYLLLSYEVCVKRPQDHFCINLTSKGSNPFHPPSYFCIHQLPFVAPRSASCGIVSHDLSVWPWHTGTSCSLPLPVDSILIKILPLFVSISWSLLSAIQSRCHHLSGLIL